MILGFRTCPVINKPFPARNSKQQQDPPRFRSPLPVHPSHSVRRSVTASACLPPRSLALALPEKRTKRGAADFDPVPDASQARRPVVPAPAPASASAAGAWIRRVRRRGLQIRAVRGDLLALASSGLAAAIPLSSSCSFLGWSGELWWGVFRAAPGFLRSGFASASSRFSCISPGLFPRKRLLCCRHYVRVELARSFRLVALVLGPSCGRGGS